MDIRSVAAWISSGIGIATVTVAIMHFVPLRPEIDRRFIAVEIDIIETEMRSLERVICDMKSESENSYRLCMIEFERDREERELKQ
jgi:hypothetical protein